MSFKKFFRRQKDVTNPMESMLSMGNSLDNSFLAQTRPTNGLSSDLMLSESRLASVDSSAIISNPMTKTSISAISGLHSHRKAKPVQQMVLAETMFDKSKALNLKCRLRPTLRQIFSDSNILPFFLQFMESLDRNSKDLIRFWLQSECLIKCEENKSKDQTFDDFKKQFISDSMRIYDNYLSESSVNCIKIPETIKIEIQKNISVKSLESLLDLFGRAQSCVVDAFENQYYDSFMKSKYYYKYQLDLLTTGSLTLADVLFGETSLKSDFLEFMESEGMKSYVDFLVSFENYRNFSNVYDDAIALFNRFFGDNTTDRLEFSETLILSISDKMVKNNFRSDCMDRAAAILIQYFEMTYLRQFIESQVFIEYLNNCFHSFQSDSIKRLKTHKRNDSDSSYISEISFCSAGREPEEHYSETKHRSSHLSEDFRSESLWKRDLSGKLQFTHIDKYGRISSQLEPEPDRNAGPLTKVMKKLSLNNTSTDKEKEEIAWRIAKMIVNDVSNCCNHSLNTQ